MSVRILFLEDDPLDAELIEREIRRSGFEVELRRVSSREEFERALVEDPPPAIILSDHNLPSYSGSQALERARAVAPGVPFILITGSLPDQVAVDYMRAGAADYVLKDRLSRLGAAVRGALEHRRREAEETKLREQLLLAQKMESVGRLAGGVAHDFNNLLTVILGNVELLLAETGSDDPKRGALEEIAQAGSKAADLTRQLLALGRRQVVRPRLLDLNALVTGLEPLLRRLLGEDLELRVERAADPGWVRADPSQLEQVVMNLVINARDAMPEGGRLTLATANAELPASDAGGLPPAAPGAYVMLAVKDTGQGMDEATRAQIFEPFFTTKAPGKGTGLGLATVYGIVKQSAGIIRVESAPGQGSTFRVYLPPDPGVVPSGSRQGR
jgi:signal transduction histidine kinase